VIWAWEEELKVTLLSVATATLGQVGKESRLARKAGWQVLTFNLLTFNLLTF
jgi:hypothetical protein